MNKDNAYYFKFGYGMDGGATYEYIRYVKYIKVLDSWLIAWTTGDEEYVDGNDYEYVIVSRTGERITKEG